MIGTDRLRALRTELEGHSPVLSLYLDVNPANPDNARRAYLLRARAALEQLDLPHGAARRWLARLRMDAVVADTRTLAIFAADGPRPLCHAISLHAELPQVRAQGGVLARWGEPYLVPLSLTLLEPRYLGVLVEEGRARFFELHLGEACELAALVQPLDPAAWRDLDEASTGAPGVPARGGSGKDLFDKRVADWRRRFRKDAGHRIEGMVQQLGVRGVLVMGPLPELHQFEAALPPSVQALVAARLNPPADPTAPVPAFHHRFLEAIDQVEAERERQVLDQIQERGVWGLGPTLEAVEEGRVRTLAVPWHLQGRVVVGSASRRVATSRSEGERALPDETFEDAELADLLPELSERHGMQLVFMHERNETRLAEGFGGLAGLTRW